MPAPLPSRRIRRRRVVGLLALAALGVAGWKSAPTIDREIQLRQARVEIDQARLTDAETRLDRMIHREPTHTRARLLYVEALRRQGRITEAELILQRTVELGLPVEQARREYALLYAWEDFETAQKSLRRLLEAHPDDQEVRQALAEGAARRR